jgi:beta-lactamase superfamily II metal-dependent hydrolase
MPLHLRTLGQSSLLAFLLASASSAQTGPVEVIFLDVGQGDAVVVRAPEGQTALIDAGPGVDLSGALADLSIESLDLVVASHPHADHIGGMGQLLERMPVRFYMDNGQAHTTATYMAVMQALRSRPEITYLEAVPRTLTLGSVDIEVLPLPERSSSNLNNNSVGLVIEHGEFRAFLSGDSERPELMHFLQARAVPDVTLLKAPHHGSDDAVSEPFLRVARPELVVISVGYGNTYGHPSVAALYTYPRYAREVYRTDVHGQVTVRGFEDGSYEVALGRTVVARGRPQSSEPVASGPPIRPTPTPAAVGSAITIRVFADAPGNDHQNTNGEYAVLSNRSGAVIDLSGWMLCDAARHCFTFPAAASIASGGSVVLYTGRGVSDGSRFFMGSGAAVWNNDGDTATLYDRSGRIVSRHVY